MGRNIFIFLRFVICWYNRPNFGPKTGVGGVYHVVIGISDFGPNQRGVYQGGVWYERDGTCDNNNGHRLVFKLSY